MLLDVVHTIFAGLAALWDTLNAFPAVVPSPMVTFPASVITAASLEYAMAESEISRARQLVEVSDLILRDQYLSSIDEVLAGVTSNEDVMGGCITTNMTRLVSLYHGASSVGNKHPDYSALEEVAKLTSDNLERCERLSWWVKDGIEALTPLLWAEQALATIHMKKLDERLTSGAAAEGALHALETAKKYEKNIATRNFAMGIHLQAILRHMKPDTLQDVEEDFQNLLSHWLDDQDVVGEFMELCRLYSMSAF